MGIILIVLSGMNIVCVIQNIKEENIPLALFNAAAASLCLVVGILNLCGKF